MRRFQLGCTSQPGFSSAALVTPWESECSRLVVVPVVDWTYGAQHMWSRHQVAVVEADEAVGDVDAVWFDPDPSSRSARSVRVLGYSHSRRSIVTVILVHRDEGGYYGANGWDSNASDRRRYREGQ